MAKRDYYRVLGVSDDADPKEIRRAFRRLAKRWHPDRNPDQSEDAAERFRVVVEAWTVLGDPMKRRRYDFETGRQPRPLDQDPARPAEQPTAAQEPAGDPGWSAVGDEIHGETAREPRGRMGTDREAMWGCLLLLVALTSPCWAPVLLGILWHIYDVIARAFNR